jgi:hypothetical protein
LFSRQPGTGLVAERMLNTVADIVGRCRDLNEWSGWILAEMVELEGLAVDVGGPEPALLHRP